ncbi:DUF3723 domain-containing protein [Pyrenophora tritici-repentis]|nr:DUF3723 domain-containing protein [Pyrenophora tritici-repentis]KAI0606741.1 DUF3723 domain-containing protein [Pyrenophora tritici-repentis]KAI0619005.1 DUF3723 domain-containing protein [Pyrenophora tritici-repentis]
MFYSQGMNQAHVNKAEEDIERQKSSHFRGRARVPLEFLHFSEHSPRDLDRGNVERLMGVYRDEGVKRLQCEHHIPTIIGKDDLLSAVHLSGLSLVHLLNSSQDDPPRLTFPEGFRLRCLHGKHRIEAAKLSACLQGQDRWWTVTLYSEGLSTQAKRSLVEDYSSSQKFSDGLIFRKMVEYETSDDYSRQHWSSWLTDCKKDILGRIFAHTEYNAALRKLMRIPALLEDLNITVWHRIIATRSDEEFLHYITRILATFDYICGRQKRLWIALDRETVMHVQSRCPGTSLNDLRYLQRLMHERRIFRAVDDDTRQEIWTRLRKVKHLIPTLGSLQQDLKYIRGPAMAVFKLLSPAKGRRQGRRTLRNLAKSAFLMSQRQGKVTIQITDDSTQEISGEIDDKFEIGFQQLYLFAMRESWNLVNDCPLKERARKTPSTRSPDPIVWHGFAQLAYTLGFESPEIQRLRQMNPSEEKARQVLLDKQGWHCEDALLQRLLTDAARLFGTKSHNPSALHHEPQMLADGSGEPVNRRQGRCYENAYYRDRQHMFLKTLSQPINGCADSVTSLFVRRSVHHAFFPSCEIESEAPVVSEPDEGTDGIRTREHNGDIDMPDAAAADRSNVRGDDFNASPNPDAGSSKTSQESGLSTNQGNDFDACPNPDAGSTETLQEGDLSTNQGVRDDLVLTTSTASMGAMKKSLIRKRPTSSISSERTSPPAPSLALQLVNVDENDPVWTRKRPRTAYELETIEGQSVVEHASGGENQTVVESPSVSLTSGKSAREDAHAENSNSTEVTIWADFEGDYKELEGFRCNSSEEVEGVLQRLQAQCPCYPSTRTGRGIMPSECYEYARSSDGGNRVYVTIDVEL